MQAVTPESDMDAAHLPFENGHRSFVHNPACPPQFALPGLPVGGIGSLRLKLLGKRPKGLGENLASVTFHVGIGHSIEERVFSREGVQRESISAGHMPSGGIAKVCRYGQGAAIELISQHAAGKLIHYSDDANSQNKHHPSIDTANLPLESDPSRFVIHVSRSFARCFAYINFSVAISLTIAF